jgi:hypothetical protein
MVGVCGKRHVVVVVGRRAVLWFDSAKIRENFWVAKGWVDAVAHRPIDSFF